MKILFLTNAYPDFDSSYRGIFIKKMAELLHSDGYKVSIVTPKIYKKSCYFENQNGVKVYRFPFFAKNKLLIEYDRIPYFRMFLYYIVGFLTAIYVGLRRKCELIHVHWAIPTGLIGVWVGTLLKKPLIVTIHGSDLRMALEKQGFLRKIFNYVCEKAPHVNCVSEVQKREIGAMGIPKEMISVIPMGVDEVFLDSGRNRKVEMEGPSFTVLSNRNLIPIYNVSLLIRAIPMILKEEPRTQFIIAGDGSEKENLKNEVKNSKLSSSVQFLGRIPHTEMPNLLSQSDIYVSTSLYDGTSVSLLEAMASGCFPIVSDIPSNREWIRDGENGFLFPVDDEKILASKILNAIHDKELLERVRNWNRSIIEEKALWPVCIEKMKGIYEDPLLRK